MDTIILQCKIIQSSLLSCNLPLFAYNRYQSLLSSTSTSSSYVVFQLINDDNIYHYIVWTGDISNGEYHDRIQIPNIWINNSIKEDSLLNVTPIEIVPHAVKVEMIPLSEYDWEVISSSSLSSSLIENTLIRSHRIVYNNQLLIINTTKEITIRLKVLDIKSIDGKKIDVGKLTENTTILIAPVLSTTSLKEMTGKSSTPSYSSIPTFEMLSLSSSLIKLRVLPYKFRSIGPSSSSTTTTTISADNIIEKLLNDDTDDIDTMGSGGLLYQHDEYSCILHPSYLIDAYNLASSSELKLNTNINEIYKNVSPYMYVNKVAWYLGRLDVTNSNSNNQETRPLASSLFVRVTFDSRIRPYHISLPLNIRKALNLNDNGNNNEMRLRLVDPNSHRPAVNSVKLVLEPLKWTNIGTRSSSTTTLQSSSLKTLDTLKLLLSAERDKACNGPFFISNDMILTLKYNVHTDDDDSNDYLLHLIIKNNENYYHQYYINLDDEDSFTSFLDSMELTDSIRFIPITYTYFYTNDDASNLSKPLRHLYGFEELLTSLITDMLTVLLPLAVYDRISSSSSPSLGLLLVGSKASGKTSVIRYIESIASNSPRIVAQTVTIDCKCLRGKPMKLVLDSLTALFTKASRSLPSLITIDNLDAICPAVDEIEGGPSVDESNIIAMHINKHFSYLRGQMCNESQDDNIPLSSNDDNNDSTNYDFIHVISKAMDKSVYVIATTSSRVNSLLLSPLGLKQQINVPFLSSSSRIELLSQELMSLGFPLADVTANEINPVVTAMEGYRVGDIIIVAKRVATVVSRRIHRQRQNYVPVKSAIKDIYEALEDFSPFSQSKGMTGHKQKVSWDAIGGMAVAKDTIASVFKTPVLYRRLFSSSAIKIPRAMLLYGPPGCGKTYLAHSIEDYCGLKLITVRGPQLLDKYIGASEKAVRELFERARGLGRPSLIFFDEFEAIAPRRGKDNTGVTDRVVNQLLTFIDGVEATMEGGGGSTIYILAATSRPDLIDVALLRPGRIEKHCYIGLPTPQERSAIIRAELSSMQIGDDIDEAITIIVESEKSSLFTQADLKALVNDAYHEAIKNNSRNSSHELDLWSDGHSVLIQSRDLLRSFERLRPSLSSQDLQFYDSVYTRFRHQNDESDYSVADSSNDIAKQRLALK